MEHSIDYGRTNIKFTVNRKKRETLGINVLPSGEVTIDAPENATIDKIKEVVNKRAGWVLKQQREVASFHPPMPPKQYLAGETFRYLGQQYRLSIINSENDEIKLTRDRIEVYFTAGNDPDIIRKKVQCWFKEQAHTVFTERLDLCMPKVKKFGITSIPTVKLRKMDKRWGSCTNDGIILLNPELISAPVECIDYVIVHELCHLKEHNHNSRFYRLLTMAMPDWENYKRLLDSTALSEERLCA